MHEDDERLSKKIFHYQFRSQQDDRDCAAFHFFSLIIFDGLSLFGKKGCKHLRFV